jgi:hypothetical protein
MRSLDLFVFALGIAAQQTQDIRGRVIDRVGGAIANASVRVMLSSDRRTIGRTMTDARGSFHVDAVPAGKYAISVSARYFRERLIENVRVEAGGQVDVGTVILGIPECNEPDSYCGDTLSAEPPANALAYGDVTLEPVCTLDLDLGKSQCTIVLDGLPENSPLPDKRSDVWLRLDTDKRLYLELRNGALTARPNSAASDCQGAAYSTKRVRIDGLEPASDVCVRTSAGNLSHIVFTTGVRPGDQRVQIYFVTRKPMPQ